MTVPHTLLEASESHEDRFYASEPETRLVPRGRMLDNEWVAGVVWLLIVLAAAFVDSL